MSQNSIVKSTKYAPYMASPSLTFAGSTWHVWSLAFRNPLRAVTADPTAICAICAQVMNGAAALASGRVRANTIAK